MKCTVEVTETTFNLRKIRKTKEKEREKQVVIRHLHHSK